MARNEVPYPSLRAGGPRRVLRSLVLLVLLLLVGVVCWTWFTLSWAYSDGERAGVLQKFARKGWVCKTHEGEIAFYYGGGQFMAPGSSPQMWDFSVRDEAIARQLDKAVGHRVQLHYTEHRGVLSSCFAETRYFVDRVTDEEAGGQTPATNSSAASSPSAPSSALPDVRPGATLAPPPPPKP